MEQDDQVTAFARRGVSRAALLVVKGLARPELKIEVEAVAAKVD